MQRRTLIQLSMISAVQGRPSCARYLNIQPPRWIEGNEKTSPAICICPKLKHQKKLSHSIFLCVNKSKLPLRRWILVWLRFKRSTRNEVYIYTASLNTYNNNASNPRNRFLMNHMSARVTYTFSCPPEEPLSTPKNLVLRLWTVFNVLLLHCGLKYLSPWFRVFCLGYFQLTG